MIGLHDFVEINFMTPGHTKFVPDLCFGMIKRRFKREVVDCVQDLACVVERSSPVANTNIAQLAGKEDGTQLVETFDWRTFLEPFKKVADIRNTFYFRISR